MQTGGPASGLAGVDSGHPKRRMESVTYDGLVQRRPVAAGEEGGGRTLRQGMSGADGGVAAKHAGKVGADRHETALVELRVVHREHRGVQVHVRHGQPPRFSGAQPGAVEQDQEGPEGLGIELGTTPAATVGRLEETPQLLMSEDEGRRDLRWPWLRLPRWHGTAAHMAPAQGEAVEPGQRSVLDGTCPREHRLAGKEAAKSRPRPPCRSPCPLRSDDKTCRAFARLSGTSRHGRAARQRRDQRLHAVSSSSSLRPMSATGRSEARSTFA